MNVEGVDRLPFDRDQEGRADEADRDGDNEGIGLKCKSSPSTRLKAGVVPLRPPERLGIAPRHPTRHRIMSRCIALTRRDRRLSELDLLHEPRLAVTTSGQNLDFECGELLMRSDTAA